MFNPTDMAKLIHNIIALHYDKGNTVKLISRPWYSFTNINNKANTYAKIAVALNTSELIPYTFFQDTNKFRKVHHRIICQTHRRNLKKNNKIKMYLSIYSWHQSFTRKQQTVLNHLRIGYIRWLTHGYLMARDKQLLCLNL